jgi:hypothetical protein
VLIDCILIPWLGIILLKVYPYIQAQTNLAVHVCWYLLCTTCYVVLTLSFVRDSLTLTLKAGSEGTNDANMMCRTWNEKDMPTAKSSYHLDEGDLHCSGTQVHLDDPQELIWRHPELCYVTGQ